jgi:hypothetical protein
MGFAALSPSTPAPADLRLHQRPGFHSARFGGFRVLSPLSAGARAQFHDPARSMRPRDKKFLTPVERISPFGLIATVEKNQ